MRHHWWHRQRDGYYAVCVEGGQIVSAWIQVSRYEWEPIADFTALEAADRRAEWHKNPYGFTDSLGPSRGLPS